MNSPVLWLGEQQGFTSKIEVSQCNAAQYLHINAFLIFFFFQVHIPKLLGGKMTLFFTLCTRKYTYSLGFPFYQELSRKSGETEPSEILSRLMIHIPFFLSCAVFSVQSSKLIIVKSNFPFECNSYSWFLLIDFIKDSFHLSLLF